MLDLVPVSVVKLELTEGEDLAIAVTWMLEERCLVSEEGLDASSAVALFALIVFDSWLSAVMHACC